MQKFSIYIQSNKFYWSINRILYSIIFLLSGIMLFKEKVLKIGMDFIDVVFICTLLGTIIFGIVSKFINFSKIEPLRGKLEGYFSFESKAINISDKIYSLEEIRKINISNDDYSGKLVNISKGEFGPALSNGTRNWLLIYFNSGETKRYQFELINSNDFRKVKTELINYYIEGKIEFDNLANVLGEKKRREREELKVEIEKHLVVNGSL